MSWVIAVVFYLLLNEFGTFAIYGYLMVSKKYRRSVDEFLVLPDLYIHYTPTGRTLLFSEQMPHDYIGVVPWSWSSKYYLANPVDNTRGRVFRFSKQHRRIKQKYDELLNVPPPAM